jgi:hypothetical protein
MKSEMSSFIFDALRLRILRAIATPREESEPIGC